MTRSSGTNTSFASKSWLPVPRRPRVRHVSWMVQSRADNIGTTISGIPPGPILGPEPSNTTDDPPSQSLALQFDAIDQRPVMR